jgi:hypothetical protein
MMDERKTIKKYLLHIDRVSVHYRDWSLSKSMNVS